MNYIIFYGAEGKKRERDRPKDLWASPRGE
jgi:hypothetical protein